MNVLNRLAQVFDKPQSIPTVSASKDALTTVLSIVFTVAGTIAVLVITIAGFEYVISQGDPQRTTKAKNSILYAVIGLVIAITGYALVNFVVGKVF